MLYAAIVGVSLLIPWVSLPNIAREPRLPNRIRLATAAGLLPSALTMWAVISLFSGWDQPPWRQLRLSLSIATWFLPAIGVLTFTAVYGGKKPALESKKTNPIYVASIGVLSLLWVSAFAGFYSAAVGWTTRTESPNTEQVADAREFLFIDPDVEIEPLAYYVKDGMDYMVRFKFIAKTHDPTRLFDRSRVDPSAFRADFDFPPGEEMHREGWWDIFSRPMAGGFFPVPHGRTLVIGYIKNNDNTFTVYAWRHEGALEESMTPP